MEKELLRSVENLEAVDVLSEKKLQRNLELRIMIKALSMKLQKSLVYHRNTSRKMQNYYRRKDYLPMHLQGVTLQENQ